MKIRILLAMHQFALAVAGLLLLVTAPGRAHAAFVFTLTQSGGDVIVDGSGTINLAALTLVPLSGSVDAGIVPSEALLAAGPHSTTSFSFYQGLSGPSSFGPGDGATASSGSGSVVMITDSGGFGIALPSGYTSGGLLTDSNTYTGETFASLGFTPGTYTYTWGSGATADSLTVTSVVPEPSTWAALALGSGLLGLIRFVRAARA